jgi:hypothetical protein
LPVHSRGEKQKTASCNHRQRSGSDDKLIAIRKNDFVKTGHQNEHDFDCCDFMALAAPHRWPVVADFMSDRNGLKEIDSTFPAPEVVDIFKRSVLRPDYALIIKEENGVSFTEFEREKFRQEQKREDETIARKKRRDSKPRRKPKFPTLREQAVRQLSDFIPPQIWVPSSDLPRPLIDLIKQAQERKKTTLIVAKSGNKRMSGFLITDAGQIKTTEISSATLEKAKSILLNGATQMAGKKIRTVTEYPDVIEPLGYVFNS